MKVRSMFVISGVALIATPAVFAKPVAVDYDHSENFNQLRTCSRKTVSTANSLWDKRVKDGIDRELTAKGSLQ